MGRALPGSTFSRRLGSGLCALLAALLAAAGPCERLPVEEADALARSVVEDGRAAGLSVAILRGERALFARGYGRADLETGAPATERTLFRIASVTKRFTAYAILRLVEDGELALDAAIAELLPGQPAHLGGITVAQLLTHTSGIPDVTGLGERYWSQIAREVEPEEIVALVRFEPLDFQPGTGYAYSNTGYLLLGRIVERVSGLSYPEYLRRRVFEPLGLDDTVYCADAADHPRLARPYSMRDGSLQAAPAAHMSQGYSTGGVCATAEDVARFVRALHHGAVAPGLHRRMTSPPTLPDGTRLSYGFGVGVGELGGHRLYFHGGGFFGADAQAVHFPEDDLTVVVLANTDGADAMRLENRISRLLLGVEDPAPRPLADPALYAGTYVRGGTEMVVEAGGGGLTVRGLWGEAPVPLSYLGEHTFAARGRLRRLRFEPRAEPPRLVLSHYGARIAVFERRPVMNGPSRSCRGAWGS